MKTIKDAVIHYLKLKGFLNPTEKEIAENHKFFNKRFKGNFEKAKKYVNNFEYNLCPNQF